MTIDISKNLDKRKLHHAYLVEGGRDEVIPEILNFFENLSEKEGPEIIQISLDSLKIDDARNLKSSGIEKGFSDNKKVFIVSANAVLLEAQNSLLKLFEEPIANTHFFLIVPDTNSLLKTLISRFYLIKTKSESGGLKEAEQFISMPLQQRIDFIKSLLIEEEESEEEVAPLDSARSKALRFLNALETILNNKLLENYAGGISTAKEGGKPNNLQVTCFKQIFKVREFLRMPGSAPKTLMESVALVIPVL